MVDKSRNTTKQGAGRSIRSQREFEEVMAKRRPDLEVVGEYKGCYAPVRVRSRECGHEFEGKPDSLYRAKTCPVCRRQREVWDDDSFKAKMSDIHPEINVLGRYVNSRTGVRMQCRDCGHVWYGVPSNVHGMGSGCPKCGRKKQGWRVSDKNRS